MPRTYVIPCPHCHHTRGLAWQFTTRPDGGTDDTLTEYLCGCSSLTPYEYQHAGSDAWHLALELECGHAWGTDDWH